MSFRFHIALTIAVALLAASAFSDAASLTGNKNVVSLTTHEFDERVLNGEWLIVFHADWCPHCKRILPILSEVARRVSRKGAKIATVDVDQEPILSGRFYISSLPTIYHIKDGEVRYFGGARDENSIVEFVQSGYQSTEPMNYLTSPMSPHLRLLGHVFKFALFINQIYDTLINDYELPVPAVVAIVIFGVLASSVVLAGFMIVVTDIFSWLFGKRTSAAAAAPQQQQKAGAQQAGSKDTKSEASAAKTSGSPKSAGGRKSKKAD